MKTLLTALIAALAMVVSVGSARAQTTLGFDDLPTLPGGGILGLDAPTLYQGLDFSNAAFNSRWYWDTDTGPWVAASGPHSLSTRDGLGLGLIEGATITSSTPFTFGGAFFSGLAANVFIELTAVDGTRERLGGFDYSFASGATFSLAAGPLSFVNPLSGLSLSAITIWAETGSFAMDDLLINGITGSGPPVAPIPEPSTYALMILGLATVGWQAKRRRQMAAVAA